MIQLLAVAIIPATILFSLAYYVPTHTKEMLELAK